MWFCRGHSLFMSAFMPDYPSVVRPLVGVSPGCCYLVCEGGWWAGGVARGAGGLTNRLVISRHLETNSI